eukprot:GEZU01020097.1.p2 GENE.GEZU01020097.1~~GEZU01020097.1.p2  ORF type:complete len:271 (-),score=51.88 GEZU01020097.1:1158-1970(-)
MLVFSTPFASRKRGGYCYSYWYFGLTPEAFKIATTGTAPNHRAIITLCANEADDDETEMKINNNKDVLALHLGIQGFQVDTSELDLIERIIKSHSPFLRGQPHPIYYESMNIFQFPRDAPYLNGKVTNAEWKASAVKEVDRILRRRFIILVAIIIGSIVGLMLLALLPVMLHQVARVASGLRLGVEGTTLTTAGWYIILLLFGALASGFTIAFYTTAKMFEITQHCTMLLPILQQRFGEKGIVWRANRSLRTLQPGKLASSAATSPTATS